jgi:hypothetical protein
MAISTDWFVIWFIIAPGLAQAGLESVSDKGNRMNFRGHVMDG